MTEYGTGRGSGTLGILEQSVIHQAIADTWGALAEEPKIYPLISMDLQEVAHEVTIRGYVRSGGLKRWSGAGASEMVEPYEQKLRVYQYNDMISFPWDTTLFSPLMQKELNETRMMVVRAHQQVDDLFVNALAGSTTLSAPFNTYLTQDARHGVTDNDNKGASNFSGAALEAGILAMGKYKDKRGRHRLGWPRPNLLILNPCKEFSQVPILGAGPLITVVFPTTGTPATQSNVNPYQNAIKYIRYSHALEQNQFILVDTSKPWRPLIINAPFKGGNLGDLGIKHNVWSDFTHKQNFADIDLYIGYCASEHWYTFYNSTQGTFPTLYDPKKEVGVMLAAE